MGSTTPTEANDFKVSVNCTLSTVNSYFFLDYCERMQRRKPDVVRQAVLEFLKRQGLAVDMENS